MDPQILHELTSSIWALARRQHGVVARRQLLEFGFSPHAIKHRVAKGRLHPVFTGVYAVGRPELTQHGRFIAAVLACGSQAALSHESAAGLWEIRRPRAGTVELTVPARRAPGNRPGIVVHRRSTLTAADITQRHGIPVTTPVCTIIDLAARLERDALEAAIGEADKRGLTDPEELRAAVDAHPHRRGAPMLRETLDRRTFTTTHSGLERLFLPIAERAGLQAPQTQAWVNGFRVDFYWPELGLVVETDGLAYHRTAAQQTRDRLRDQKHYAAGLTPLRFTHSQVKSEAAHVEATLRAAVRRAA
jgi:very-short-patch-repair endonuclease